MVEETTEACVERLVLEYAQSLPGARPLDAGLSLANDLAIESLSLVALALRLSGEFGVDIVDLGLELRGVKTLGDLVDVARILRQQAMTNGRKGMIMENKNNLKDAEDPCEQPVAEAPEDSTEEDEFKVTVRKLELPARPRGVLAE